MVIRLKTGQNITSKSIESKHYEATKSLLGMYGLQDRTETNIYVLGISIAAENLKIQKQKSLFQMFNVPI
jgi:hypothetical protein